MTSMALGAATAATAAQNAGTTSSQTGATSGTAANRSSFASGDFQTFLTMLTAQIKNQDPMNPMDNAEFAVQLATFSGVEQQVRTNQLLEGLNGGAGGLAQYADWIGREVRSTTPALFIDQPITLEIAPAADADKVVLVARDSAGRAVSSEDVGTASGQVDWFGRDAAGVKLADGTYSFEIENWTGGEKTSVTKVESYSRVIEAESGPGGVTLITSGGGGVTADSVTGLREAPAPVTQGV